MVEIAEQFTKCMCWPFLKWKHLQVTTLRNISEYYVLTKSKLRDFPTFERVTIDLMSRNSCRVIVNFDNSFL